MLNKRESEVMSAIYSLCYEKGICLISPDELLAMLPTRKKYNEEQIEKIFCAKNLTVKKFCMLRRAKFFVRTGGLV